MDRFIDKRVFEPLESGNFFNDEDVKSWNDNGILLMRNAIPLERVEKMREIAAGSFYGDYEWITAPELLSEEIMSHYTSPEVQKPLQALNGESEVIQGFIYRKRPRTDVPKNWHQDGVYWGGDTAKVVAIFTPLTEMSKKNGVLWYYPGSHKLGRLYHRAAPNYNLICDVSAFSEPQCIEIFPGDLFFMHSHLVHASFANESDADRLSLGFHVYNKQTNIEINQPVIDDYKRIRAEMGAV